MDLFPGSLSVVTMNTERAVVYGVVGLVLATTLVSGPLVGGIDFTPAPEEPSFGDGNASIGDVSLPARAQIRSERFGSGEYSLRVPDATVELLDVTGNPSLAYQISIRAIGYARTTTHFVTASDTGTYGLSLEQDSIDPSQVENGTYDGTLRVFLRSNGTERRLGGRNITVEVTE